MDDKLRVILQRQEMMNKSVLNFAAALGEMATRERIGRRLHGETNNKPKTLSVRHLLSEKFRNMSEEKKTIVRDLGFGGLMHIPPLKVHHQILRELANSFKLGENRLETGYGSFKVRQKIIGAALGINALGDLFPQKVNYKDLSEDDKQIFRRFQGKTLKNLTDEMMTIGVGNEQDRLMFKRIFILYIQMAFLLPTTINKISHVHLAPIFKMDTITEQNWGAHVLNFIIKGITNYNLKKKKAIDGCLFALMIVYFHQSKNKDKKRAERPPEPWIANWTREQLVERMRAEMEEHMASSTSSSETEITKNDHSTSESETEEDSEDSTRKQPSRKVKKSEIGTEDLDEFLRENNEKSAAQGEKEADLRSTEGHYVSSETILDVNLGSDDPSSQGHTDQSSVNKLAESMLSGVEESASEPAEENMMVVREETQSEVLAIVPIQVCLPLSQTTTMLKIEETPETENEPTSVLQIEGTTKALLNPPPNNLKKAHPRFPQLHLKCKFISVKSINPTPEDTAALMMMARTASYVPKTDPMPSFSLGLTDSSQEEVATQEGASTQDGGWAKTPETPKLLEQLGIWYKKLQVIPKESGAESFEKLETPTRTNQHTSDMKEKCYLWAIRVKKYADGLTNEFDTVCTLQAQDRYILSKLHLASLAPETHIEAEIVSAMCFILNQQKIKRFQEKVYCLPPDIVNMALGNHPQGVFLQPKNNKPFRVEDYLMCIPFLDLKKLASHRYGYVISRIKVCAGGAPLKTRDKDKEIEPPYLNISGQKTSYDCTIYDEVDHFRVEYASRILFHEMNQDKAEAIRGSNAIRLSKPSSLLLSPYCHIDSKDIDTN
ncbi:hypothetical protein Ahy_B01g054464 [Arachis hypogaea]|uniref:Aminotransferase-like plant mobile domain-containing protein n=1 Tax=Arachis hypogaea TaxID=3818 RepID=A0A445ATX0_ARAHY|nr:hypothetical protein Ahy_B01g054464 [Arachis hypogaea]